MQLSTEKNPTLVKLERVERKAASETETAGTAEIEFPFTITSNSKRCEYEIKQELNNIKIGIQTKEWFEHLMMGKCEYEYEWLEKITEENTVPIVHKWFSSDDERQKMVQYAYKLGWIDFVTMMECENWNWNIKAIGDGGHAFGLCQMNTRYHKLPEGYRDTWQVQVEYCYEKRSTGTKFYWPTRKIKGQTCKNYVLDRFIINDVE